MRPRARLRVGDALVSALCIATVVAVLVGIDTRVRDRFSTLVGQVSSQGPRAWGDQLGSLVDTIWQAVRDQSIARAPLLIFGFVAIVLLILMLRT